MAKTIMQFRYYGDTDPAKSAKNYPNVTNMGAKLCSGSLIRSYGIITQLGIQSLPGTAFYLNDSPSPIVIGSTGIYELDLEGISEITSIRFTQPSIETIDKNATAYLIIDTISEKDT